MSIKMKLLEAKLRELIANYRLAYIKGDPNRIMGIALPYSSAADNIEALLDEVSE